MYIVLTDQTMNAIGNFDSGHHLLVGDLNSQNPTWGSQNLSRSRALWENFADDSGLVPHNSSYEKHIDCY